MSAGVVLLASLAGLLLGSFLNVVIARVPYGESIARPPSHCPQCGHVLAWYDNIPVASWMSLRARCRYCKEPISARYPIVELSAAGLLAITAWRAHSPGDLVALGVGFIGLLAVSVVDLDLQRVPVRILYPTMVLVAVSLVVTAAVEDRWADLGRAAAGGAIGFATLWIIHTVAPKGMGYGDVRLAGLCGLLLGWRGLAYVPIGLYGAFVLGAIVGVALIAVGRGRFGRHIPFAPYLAAGCVYVSLFGAPLARALRHAFGGT